MRRVNPSPIVRAWERSQFTTTVFKMNFNSPRSKTACRLIHKMVEDARGSKGVSRTLMVEAFKAVGYVQHLAERGATALIKANTDIDHWSRWKPNLVNEGDKLNVYYLPCTLGVWPNV